MIDWKRTKTPKEYFDKFPKSHKKVLRVCDNCGDEKLVDYSNHQFLICHPCSLIGNKQALGMKHTDETKKLLSEKLTGLKRSDEQKENYRNSKLGDKNPQYGLTGELSINYGKKVSDETRKKQSKVHSGKHCSKETKQKLHDINIGKTISKESRIKQSCTKQGIPIDEFNGFIKGNRIYLLHERDCIKMNDKFKGSHFHHITKSLGIYIPGELHNHISHNLKTGLNMGGMNALAIQYINGGLDI